MTFDWTLTIGNLMEVTAVLGGGIGFMLTMRSDIAVLKKDDADLRSDITGIQSEIKKIGEVLNVQARQDQRILHLEQDMRDIRHKLDRDE